jgi:hypothetical protein
VIGNLADKGIGAIGDRDALLRHRLDIDRVDGDEGADCQSPLARL